MKYQATQTIVADGVKLNSGDVFEDGHVHPGCLASMLRLGQVVPVLEPRAGEVTILPGGYTVAPVSPDAKDAELDRLRRENEELRATLAEHEAAQAEADKETGGDPSLATRKSAADEIIRLRAEVERLKLDKRSETQETEQTPAAEVQPEETETPPAPEPRDHHKKRK